MHRPHSLCGNNDCPCTTPGLPCTHFEDYMDGHTPWCAACGWEAHDHRPVPDIRVTARQVVGDWGDVQESEVDREAGERLALARVVLAFDALAGEVEQGGLDLAAVAARMRGILVVPDRTPTSTPTPLEDHHDHPER